MPKQFIAIKWAVYGCATLFFLLVQIWLLDRIHVQGITPFLGPMLVGVIASLEGSRQTPIYALVFGFLSDLGGHPPALGFYTFFYPLGALLAAWIARRFLSKGVLSALATTAIVYLTVDGAMLFLLGEELLTHGAYLAGMEFLVTLPAFVFVYPILSAVEKKTTIDY